MHIHVDWERPIQLTRHRKPLFDENSLPEKIEDRPGVYFFSRRFGSKFQPFYIGETMRIRPRLREHLGSRKIAFVLLDLDPKSEILGGVRYFHYAYIGTKNVITKTRLKIVQRYLFVKQSQRE